MALPEFTFLPASTASGVQNISGKGYWYHRLYRPLLSFEGAQFWSKTFTLLRNEGRMPLEDDGETPRELFPRCIIVKPLKGLTLNAVGLSNFGAEFYLGTGKWQQRTEPFVLSFMCIAKTRKGRMEELRHFVKLLSQYLHTFRAPIVLELNFSCPNTSHDLQGLLEEVLEALEITAGAGIKTVPKFNILLPPSRALEISRHPGCFGINVSNTIPWGELPMKIDWVGLFGTTHSPLAKRLHDENAKGGLSGPPLFPLVCEWIDTARRIGIRKHIIAGGGLFHPNSVDRLKQAGASSVSIGTVVIHRPWRVQPIIARAYRVFRRYH